METLKIFAPIAPFITEEIYQSLKNEFRLETESIHLYDWPGYDSSMIDENIEKNLELAKETIQSILFAREKIKRGVRWPIKEITIAIEDKSIKKEIEEMIALFEDIIRTQANVKYIKIGESTKTESKDTESFDSRIGKIIVNKELDDELLAEGYSREITRRIQAIRKKQGMVKNDSIELLIAVPEDLQKLIEKNKGSIAKKVGAEKIIIEKQGIGIESRYSIISKEKIKEKEITIAIIKQT